MKNLKVKILGVIALSAISIFSLAGFISAKTVMADGAVDNVIAEFEELDFHMNGAAIRKKTHPGIRFEAEIDENAWNVLLEGAAAALENPGDYMILETGLIMIPERYLKAGKELTFNTSGSVATALEPQAFSDRLLLRAGISPIDSELYDVRFTARGYIQYNMIDAEGEEQILYRYADTKAGENDMSTRSLRDVMEFVKNSSEYEEFNESELSFFNFIDGRTKIEPEKTVYNVGEEINVKDFAPDADKFFVAVRGGEYGEIGESYVFENFGSHKFKAVYGNGISDSFTVDAVSEGHELDAVSVDDMYANCAYKGYSWHATSIQNDTKVDTYDIGGINERMFAYSGNKIEKSMIFGKPAYTKKYYEDLLNGYKAENIKAFVDFSYYFENITRPMSSFATLVNNVICPDDGVFLPFNGSFRAQDKWATESLSLEKFVGLYDNLYKGYVWEKNSKRPQSIHHDTVLGDEIDYLLSIYHYSNLDPNFSNIYVRDMKIRTEAKISDIGTVLADRSKTAEVNFSGNIEGREYDSLQLVSRYGNRDVTITENSKFAITDDMEDGLYYLKGIKDGAESFRLTFDIYDGTKPVEVESFAHSDSKEAVKLYYIAARYTMTGVIDPEFVPAERMRLDFDNPAHGLSIGKMDLPAKRDCCDPGKIYDNLKDVYYLGIDESKFTAESPMPVGDLKYSWVDGEGADIYIYVLPRHSKEYYELYKDTCSRYAFAYTGGMDNSTYGNGQMFGYISSIDDAGHIGFVDSYMTWNDWVYSSAATGGHPTGVTAFTIDDFIRHYDDFADGRVWSMKFVKPAFSHTTLTAKMFGITFIASNDALYEYTNPTSEWGL